MKPFAITATPALALLMAVAPGHLGSTISSDPVRPVTVARTNIAPVDITVFTNVNVVPMDREQVLTNQTVVVKAGRIEQIGPASKVSIPAGATHIDGRGKYLIPGLADMHAHLFLGPHIATTISSAGLAEVSVPWSDSAEAETRLFLWLANGATTVRDLDYVGNEEAIQDTIGHYALNFRARATTGREWLPRIYTAGQFAPRQYLQAIPSDPAPRLDSVAAYVIAYKARGFDHLKIHDEQPAVLDSIMVTAKRIGLPVVGHVPVGVSIEHILPYYKSIEHPLTEYAWTGRTGPGDANTTGLGVLALAMARAGVANCPTQSHYDRTHYDLFSVRPPKYLTVLRDAGVKLLLGTDEVPWTGSLTRELQAMVESGLTPYQALQTGTSDVAEYFGTLSESGTIAVGKRADLLLLTGNPLQDIHYTAQPAGVMIGGRWLPRAEIDRRVATMRLPMPNRGDTVRGYWYNVMREATASSAPVLNGITWTEAQRSKLHELQASHATQRNALIDSLGKSDQYAASTTRVFRLVLQQLQDDRVMMTSDQSALFDSQLKTWEQKRAAQLQ